MSKAATIDQMHAARIRSFGDSSMVRLETVPRPTPAPGEVLLQVHAAGVNPIDWKVRQGFMGAAVSVPCGLGYDVAGTVMALGAGASAFRIGDRVFGMLSTSKPGTYAQFVAAPDTWLARIPEGLDFVRAAALPMGMLTAWLAVAERGHITQGQRVLVHGGAGSVGQAAIQLAKQRGAWVAATASGAGLTRALASGADLAIDYREERFDQRLHNLDVVIDTQGGETQQRSWSVLREGGLLVSTLGTPEAKDPAARGRTAAPGFATEPDGARLQSLSAGFNTGALAIAVAKVMPLAEAAAAMDLQESGKAGGKVVLRVTE